jgi:CRISPR-associated protein (TIGR02584 family)
MSKGNQGRGSHILFAVTGMTPQVVTETLYALMVQRKLQINEIYVVTTAEGKEKLLSPPSLGHEIIRLCEHYQMIKPSFDPETHVIVAKEESIELHDIRSDRDNKLIPNIICDFVRKKTQDRNTVLHCSLAGGRKTMSVAMAFALSLFGRKHDKLYHVLVSDELEKSKKYFPETLQEEQQIVLSEVPYISLREKLPLLREHPEATFSELVEIAQEGIDELEAIPRLIFDKSNCSVHIGEKKIKLQPFDFAFYLFVAKQKQPVLVGKSFSQKDQEELRRIYISLSPPVGNKERIMKTISGVERAQRLTKSASNVRRILRKELGPKLAPYYEIQSSGEYGKIRYHIELDKSKMQY